MQIKKLVLKNNTNNNQYIFAKQFNKIDDLALAKELGTENIKNEDSTLVISSLNDTKIYDVIQIKINLTKVGVFLANFDKTTFDDESRKKLIESLSALKVEETPTYETQSKKANKILEILNDYQPIYVTYSNTKSIILDLEVNKALKFNYPLLILPVIKKEDNFLVKFFKSKNIELDNLFIGIFSCLFSVASIIATHNLINSANIGIFLLVLSIVFLGIYAFVFISFYINCKKLKKSVFIFTLIGIVLGISIGLLVSAFLIKGDDISLDIPKTLLIGGLPSLIAPILIILIAHFILKRKQVH